MPAVIPLTGTSAAETARRIVHQAATALGQTIHPSRHKLSADGWPTPIGFAPALSVEKGTNSGTGLAPVRDGTSAAAAAADIPAVSNLAASKTEVKNKAGKRRAADM